ncbi:hypothetical protein HGO37_01980 [Rhizobium sp. CG4]|uniref:hypothetical protein n=1 Tax=Rhizobium/Agrobacterium group TaxID=227290 RepID=UPI0020342580|nr:MULTISPECIES: hypothetical protein [Rhizobium/Agrobacterium group]MCM2454144.1 hypothetical protein [Rhizobium sp. CG4]MDO5896331.1 hypothetical protein [Agrobacterium sp. Azo12]
MTTEILDRIFAPTQSNLDRRQSSMSLGTDAIFNRFPLIIHQKSSIATVYPYGSVIASVPVRFESMAYEYP